MNRTFKGDDSLLRLLLIRHTNKTVRALLHHDLCNYTLGQLAFPGFQALFAITQLHAFPGKNNVNKRLQTHGH